MFWWVHRYRPVDAPNYDDYGSLTFYLIVAISQLVLFSVPAFLFISGFFVTYATQRAPLTLRSKVLRRWLLGLLWPFLVWTAVMFVADNLAWVVLGRETELGLLRFYFFAPLLAQYYLLSPMMLWWAKRRPALLIVVAALFQLSVIVARYLVLAQISSWWVHTVAETPIWLFVRWALYFPLGTVFGLYREQVGSWVRQRKSLLFGMSIVLGGLCVLETDLIYRATGNWNWAFESTKLSVMGYGVVFILAFLMLDSSNGFVTRVVDHVGRRSYGVYLLQRPAILLLAKTVYHVAPQLLGWPVLFQVVLVFLAVGLPWMFMELVSRSPVRKLYPYLFG
jgi:hypothetical protein